MIRAAAEAKAEEGGGVQWVRLLLWLEFLAWAFGFLALTLCLLLVSQVCTAAMHAFFCGSYWGRSLWVPVPALSLHKLTISGNKCFRLFMAAIEDQPHTPDTHTHSHTHLLQCELTRDYSSRRSSLCPCLLSLSVLAVFSLFSDLLCLTNSIKHFNISLSK